MRFFCGSISDIDTMDKDVLVSVVIPVYNSEKFIHECLDATIGQTYSNIEILIVDDGSEDSTVDICRKYEKSDERIRVILGGYRGVSATRNTGIDVAKGQYIVFLDADDYPERNLIERYVTAAKEWKDRNVSFITCGMYYDNNVNKNVEAKAYILENNYGYIEGENYLLERNYVATLAWLKIFNFVTNKCYKVDIIRENRVRFDEKVEIGEDLKFNLDYLDVCDGYIGMVNSPLYHYIKRSDDSLSSTYHESDIEDTKAIYRRFLEWEKKQKGVTEDNILVIKSIFLTDWTSRLSTMNDTYRKKANSSSCKRILDSEIGSVEYQSMLKEVYRSRKISLIRYATLRTGNFDIFCFFRRLYQLSKG